MNQEYFAQFERIIDKYLPEEGEGKTMATQVVTAVVKLIYKFYNDGDVYDNSYYLDYGWNDLSSYANWLAQYAGVGKILYKGIRNAKTKEDYEKVLMKLADNTITKGKLKVWEMFPKTGTIYECDGPFRFSDEEYDEYDRDWEDEEEEEEVEEIDWNDDNPFG